MNSLVVMLSLQPQDDKFESFERKLVQTALSVNPPEPILEMTGLRCVFMGSHMSHDLFPVIT